MNTASYTNPTYYYAATGTYYTPKYYSKYSYTTYSLHYTKPSYSYQTAAARYAYTSYYVYSYLSSTLMGIMHIVLPTCIVIVLPISTVKTIGFTKRSIAINTVPNMQRLTNTIRYTPTAEWFIILPPHTAMAITIPNTTVQLRSMATKCWGNTPVSYQYSTSGGGGTSYGYHSNTGGGGTS